MQFLFQEKAMATIGSTSSPHYAFPAYGFPSGSSTTPAGPQVTRQQQPPRDVAVIEADLQQNEKRLAELYAHARQEGSPAPRPEHMRTAILHSTDTRKGRYLTVTYRMGEGSRKSHSCTLNPVHEHVSEILGLDEQRSRLRLELKNASKPYQAQIRRKPVAEAYTGSEAGRPRSLTRQSGDDDPAVTGPGSDRSRSRTRQIQALVAASHPDWMALPPEVKMSILCYLDSRSLGTIRLVGKEWDGLAMHFMPAWRFSSADDFRTVMTAFAKRGDLNKIRSLTLEGSSFKDDDLAVLSTLPNLTRLKLSCPLATDQCGKHIGRCTKLEALEVSNSRLGDDFVAGMLPAAGGDNSVLKELVLQGCDDLTERGAADIARFSSLKKLGARQCNLDARFLQGLLSPAPGGDRVNISLEVLDVSENPLLGNIAGFHLSRFQGLKVLHANRCNLGDEFFEGLVPADEEGVHRNHTLEALHLGHNPGFTVASGSAISGCSNLRELALDWCGLETPFLQGLLPAAEDGVVRRNDVLEKLVLTGNPGLTDDCGSRLFHCHALRELDVGFCGLSNAFLEGFLPLPENVVLEKLLIAHNTAMTNDCAGRIARCRALNTLNAQSCRFTGDFFAQLLSTVGENQERVNDTLQSLVIAFSDGMDDESGHVFSKFVALAHLDARNCGLGDGFVMNFLRNAEQGDKEYNNVMKRLDLGGNRLTDGAGRYIRLFSELEILGVAENDEIGTDFFRNLLAESNARNKTLKTLNVSSCKKITDDCGSVLAGFEALKSLAVFNCTLLTDEFMETMPPTIKTICLGYTALTETMRNALCSRANVVRYDDFLLQRMKHHRF